MRSSAKKADCRSRGFKAGGLLIFSFFLAVLVSPASLPAQQTNSVPRITGRYHFIGPQDVLAILEEEGTLKGYVDVFQGQDESDAILSYPIALGSRKGNHVEFRTRKIHEKYYRFTGTVARGAGKKPGDPDYLQLSGEIDIITSNSVTGEQKTERRQVILKSMGKNEGAPGE